ncbi:alpha/beta hydrolase [Corynebacterium sp.]|uniref:alpha/beta hydrolase n=1 Tax=Corynebacterium sp. TaxID=1720 RepID=UPI0026DA82D9|nr:alpha/beta hydrolase fold domain-containing protein [Corynebacterium sp.]MDO5032580.1 alpha/beta hydrolase fold domain-containing protein [Corynebacterium sp.]
MALTQEEQLEHLASYLNAHYPLPDFRPPWKGGGSPDADRYCALLPDRIVQASMLLLGTAVDHSLPGTAFTEGISVEDSVYGALFVPSEPSGRFAVSLHSGGWWRGSGQALEMQWRPEVAAAAQLSGTTILDVDYPLAPEHTVAQMVEFTQAAVDSLAGPVTVWGYSSGAALASLVRADALLLTFPDFGALEALPEEIRGGCVIPQDFPRTLVQTAAQDEVAARVEIPGAETAEYVSTHRISTPEVARQRIRDTAAFLASV